MDIYKAIEIVNLVMIVIVSAQIPKIIRGLKDQNATLTGTISSIKTFNEIFDLAKVKQYTEITADLIRMESQVDKPKYVATILKLENDYHKLETGFMELFKSVLDEIPAGTSDEEMLTWLKETCPTVYEMVKDYYQSPQPGLSVFDWLANNKP